MEVNQDSLLERIRAVEEQLEKGVPAKAQEVVYIERTESKPKVEAKVELQKALHQDVQQVAKNFRSIANEASPMIRNYLKLAKLSVGNQDQLLIVLPDEVSAGVVGTDGHMKEIQNLIAEKTGKEMAIEVKQVEEGRRFEESFVDIEKIVHMDLTIED
jgi:DNA polymerase-3 subunit gamma/tau